MQITKDTKDAKRPEWFRPWWRSRVFGMGVVGLLIVLSGWLMSSMNQTYAVCWSKVDRVCFVRCESDAVWDFIMLEGYGLQKPSTAMRCGFRVPTHYSFDLSKARWGMVAPQLIHQTATIHYPTSWYLRIPMWCMAFSYLALWSLTLICWQRRKARLMQS